MSDVFDVSFFAGNRQSLLRSTGAGLVALTANGVVQRSADTTFVFRQDSNFWYLTGVDEPNFLLVFTDAESFLVSPKRSAHRDMWDGSIDMTAIKRTSGVDEIYEYHDGWNKLDRLLKKYKKIHTITPVDAYIEDFGFYSNPAKVSFLASLAKHRRLETVDIRKPLARLRQVKQPCEIDALQRAIDITVKSLRAVKTGMPRYKYEAEIYADITRDFIKYGATGHAYTPIIGSGINAATIHYMKNNSRIGSTDLVLIDAGAEYMNYSADISRTYSLERPSPRQRDVYNAVMSVYNQAKELIRPGINMRQYERQVDEFMQKELVKLGLASDITDKKKLKKYYPHLASHFLGLDTHDAADYEQALAPGCVVTLEPGIYIPEESMGIRIEDDILITDNGIKVLSGDLSTELY
ncbi:aminopeptidase P family protein [Candidatus Saccharibacteria bacterium]|nr:aminopeptidase P family protein [Candidatus Saccharibacteria bacterium]